MTLLLNFYIAQLEHNGLCLKSVSFVEQIYPIFTKGREVGRDLVQEMYGDASSLRVVPPVAYKLRSVFDFQTRLKQSEKPRGFTILIRYSMKFRERGGMP